MRTRVSRVKARRQTRSDHTRYNYQSGYYRNWLITHFVGICGQLRDTTKCTMCATFNKLVNLPWSLYG